MDKVEEIIEEQEHEDEIEDEVLEKLEDGRLGPIQVHPVRPEGDAGAVNSEGEDVGGVDVGLVNGIDQDEGEEEKGRTHFVAETEAERESDERFNEKGPKL